MVLGRRILWDTFSTWKFAILCHNFVVFLHIQVVECNTFKARIFLHFSYENLSFFAIVSKLLNIFACFFNIEICHFAPIYVTILPT